jgi:NAD(P) transhydrogenase subunit alpha
VLLGFIETCEDDGTIAALPAKGIRVIALERVPRISRAQSMDALSSQANIAGYRAVLEAAIHYGRFLPVMMTSAGSAKPARLVVLGAGVAGLQAIATARRLGADVYAYDVRPETKEQIRSLGAKPIEIDIGESGAGEGGYAKELSAEAKARQQQLLADELAKAHVIVTTALIPCRPAPVLVTEEVVQRMRPGSVIVDLAAATGGNCPLTEKDQTVVRHGVTIVGITNYPALLPSDASSFYARNLANLLDIMVEQGEAGPALKDLEADEITRVARVRPSA